MEAITHQDPCNVEDAIATTERASEQYEIASHRLDAQANVLLRPLGRHLDRIHDRLESVGDDEEVLDRFKSILVGTEALSFLNALNNDISTVGTYFQTAKSPLRENEVDGYARALQRYAEMIQVVSSRNKKDILQRIQVEIVGLNEAIANMNSHISHNNQPSEYELLTRLALLRPLQSAYHDSHGIATRFELGAHEEVISDVMDWLTDLSQPMVYMMHGESRAATTAIAQTVAAQAHEEGCLVSSFFFAWNGSSESRNPEHLIPTIMYRIARYDMESLDRITRSISMEPAIRDRAAPQQLSLLVQRSFQGYERSSEQSLLIVIDALDTCDRVDEQGTARSIAAFIVALSSAPLHFKILITSRFAQITSSIIRYSQLSSRVIELPTSVMNIRQTRADFALHAPSTNERETLLKALAPVLAARYDSIQSASGCLEGTRVNILAHMLEWCAQMTCQFSVYWLSGHAGTGKTTIAKTLCEKLMFQGHFCVATFFASRSSAEHRDPLKILYTIVHELASADGVACHRILAGICLYDDIKQRSLREQVQVLLCATLKDLMGGRSLIIVLDALDECMMVDGVEGGHLIHELALALADLPVKLVVTSRMETSLRGMFESLPMDSTRIRLHEIEGTDVRHDVRRILDKGFRQIKMNHYIQAPHWPTESEIEALVNRTGSFIIFAATVLKVVNNDRISSPQRQLSQILLHIAVPETGHVFRPIDTLYLSVLEAAVRVPQDIDSINMLLAERLQTLIGTIILLQEPLSISSLALFLNCPVEEVRGEIRALAAVLSDGPDTDSSGEPFIRVFHPSFRDFLLERCTNQLFRIKKSAHYCKLALYCLHNLNDVLRHDNLGVENPTLSNDDISLLPLVVRLPDATQYACQFWMTHLIESVILGQELLEVLYTFACKHLFHWVELLSLNGLIFLAIQRLPDVITWCKRCKKSQAISDDDLFQSITLFDDSHRMLQGYQKIISTHALQVYYSALVTMPQCSLLDRICCGEQQNHIILPCLKSPRLSEWRKNLLVLEGHTSGVRCVVFSPDGLHIASGSSDNTVRLWNAQTGHNNATLRGHTSDVRCVIFSPDGSQIASGSSDSTVRLWNAQTGQNITTLTGHTDWVTCVVSSPDGSQIASGSSDNTVRLWNAQTGRHIATLTGHTEEVTCVVFSPDGSHIASGSWDKTVGLWNAWTGHHIATLTGHTWTVTCVVFSSDGSHIASGSDDSTVRLWNAQTGHNNATLRGHTSDVRCVVFSPDDSHIASGSSDSTVRLWDVQTRRDIATLTGHTGTVTSVVFSPDGSHIASGSSDKTARLWNAQTGRHIATLTGHTYGVTCVVSSPDGSQIASGSSDNTVRLWNARTGHHIATPTGHTSGVTCVVFSPDGSRIASASWDKTVRLWNAQTGRHIATLTGHTDFVRRVVFSPDGSHIASGSHDNTVRLWDAQTGRDIATLTGYTPWITSDIFSSYAARAHIAPLHPKSHISALSDNIAPPTSSSALGYSLKNPEKTPSGHLSFDTRSNWIVWRLLPHPHGEGIKLCWLPSELRGDEYATSKGMFAMASKLTHDLTIIDFTPMLNALFKRGYIVKPGLLSSNSS